MASDIEVQQEICETALELPRDQRAAYVERETAGNTALRARIFALLREYESSDDVLIAALWPGTDLSGQTVGAYRLLKKIGEGGMGEVYLAEQKDQFSAQNVAIKLLTHTGKSQELVKRLEREKDILAQLKHPNIPTLMYSGQYGGAPYIVMEYVDGSDILTYCDDKGLDLDQRLELFLQVLEATSFAHAELIVHRDLKPENILVDTQGVVKVLDFGIAKILAEASPGQSDTEHFGRLPLSPGYAPPEQWLGQKVNTAVDAYALGVVLNQLLCGCMPFSQDSLEQQRTNIGYVPRRRSMNDSMAHADDSIVFEMAEKRGTTPSALKRTLSGDLQSIVFKATERDRHRRYASAADLAADIKRYLTGEMVSAKPVAAIYRFGRWWHRNKVPASIGALMLVMTATIAAMGVINAVQSREQALRTEQARASTEKVLNILIDMLRTNDADALQPKETTIREALVEGSDRVISDLMDTPEIQLRVLSITSSIYKEHGLHRDALRYLNAADEALSRLPNSTIIRDDIAEIRVEVASNRGDVLLGIGEYELAKAAIDEALVLATEIYGPISAPALNVMNSHKERLHYQNQYPQAMQAAEEALKVSNQLDDSAAREKAMAQSNYGVAKLRMNEPQEAIAALREAARIQAAFLPEDHPERERVQANLANLLLTTGQRESASKIYRQIIENSERRGAGDNRTLVQAIYGLGRAELDRGNVDAASALFQKSLAINTRFRNERDREVVLTRLFLGIAYSVQGELTDAEETLSPALEAQIQHRADATMTARLYARMGIVALLKGDIETAQRMLEHAQAILAAHPNPPPHHRAAAVLLSGRLAQLSGDLVNAKAQLTEAASLFSQRYGDESAFGAHARLWLADLETAIARNVVVQ